MVEGPGCTINGERIRSQVQKGQKVKEINGDATAVSSKDDFQRMPFYVFTGCRYLGVETLGKELYMYFGPRALRFHFGMNGSVRINPSDRKQRSGKFPSVVIQLTNDVICFFDTTVEIRPADECERKVKAMERLDVCSPKFSFSRAEEALRNQRTRMLCDVLLDQAVLPGVGNIIKNEVLFDSGLRPTVKVSQMTDCQIHHLVKMTRDFSLLFYKCCKSGSSIQKHNRVYKRPHCGQCDGKVTVCRLGENGRMTYFCCNCQSEDPSQANARKTLTGWLCTRGKSPCDGTVSAGREWSCELCTLINQPDATSCEACLSPRPAPPSDGEKQDVSSSAKHLMKYPCNAFAKPQEKLKVNRTAAFGTSTLVFTNFGEKSPTRPSGRANLNPLANGDINKADLSQGKVGPRRFPGSSWKRSPELPTASSQPHKKMRIDHEASPRSGGHNFTSPKAWPAMDTLSSPSSPRCVSHGCRCALQVVRKEGDNKGRRFYACALPQETRCDYFEWADLHFPTCNHGKRSLLRTVLKLGPNNGRTFYTCPLDRGRQCNFFQWADISP